MKAGVRPLAAAALLLTLAAILLLTLNYMKFGATLESRERSRQAFLADSIAQALDAHQALGLPLDDTPSIRGMLERALASNPHQRAIAVLDEHGRERVVSGSGHPALWQAARQDERGRARQDERAALAVKLHNSFGVTSGWLVSEYEVSHVAGQSEKAFSALWPVAAIALAGSLLLLALLAPRVMRRAASPLHATRRLTALIGVLLLLLQANIAWTAYQSFSQVGNENAPQLAATIGATLTPDLERALAHGIPLQALQGVESWLQPALQARPELAQVRIYDERQALLFKAARAQVAAATSSHELPLQRNGQRAGTMVIDIDMQSLAEQTHQLAIEFFTLLAAGILIGLEVMRSVLGTGTPPLVNDAGDAASKASAELARLRLPLFLFFVGSELPRAFLPMWAKNLAAQPLPAWWGSALPGQLRSLLPPLSETVQATLPMSLFLLAVALASPLAGQRCARHGPLRLLHGGLALAFAGHLLALFADSLLTLCLARMLAGASFGYVSVAAFDYIGRHGGARGMAMYLAAYVAAGICGAGLGALVEDRGGIAPVFGIGLLLTLVAALLLRRLPFVPPSLQTPPSLAGTLGRLLRQPRFLGMIALIALPMQLLQQGLLFYWVPMALHAQGQRTAFIGLAMMSYFALVLLLNGPLAAFADKSGRHWPIVLAGLALAGLASLIGGTLDSPLAIVGCVALIGVAWASGFPAHGALVFQLGRRIPDTPPAVTIGTYRMVERVAAMLAAPAVALLIGLLDYANAAKVLGSLFLLSALLQGLTLDKEDK